MLTRSLLIRAAVAVALAAGLSAGPTYAQPANSPWLFLSTNPEAEKEADPATSPATVWQSGRHSILLRPNVEQPLYLYARNPTQTDHVLTVVVANHPDEGDEIARAANVAVAMGKTVRIRPVKPAPPAPGTPAPPPPVGKPVLRGLFLHLTAGNEKLPSVEFPVSVQEPSRYVKADATLGQGVPLRLNVTLSDAQQGSRPFIGPRAKAVLGGVPGLLTLGNSTLQGEVPPGGQTSLVAMNPSFPSADPNSAIAVSVDGYARAFLFRTDFAGTSPQPIQNTLIRMFAPQYFIPDKPCPVRLEVDNPPSTDVYLEFAIDRTNGGQFSTNDLRHGPRFQKAEARWDPTAGGLVFATAVHDWVEAVDTAGLVGPRHIRMRLYDANKNVLMETSGKDEIIFDPTPPEGLRITTVGAAIRKQALNLAAFGGDPESGVKRVLFFMGDPPSPEGKPALGGRVVEGAPPTTPDGPFTAQLPLPDRIGTVAIGVRFFNNVGLARDETAEIEIAEPAAKPTTGSIKVKVGQGNLGAERPQPDLEVQLRDEKNTNVLKTGKTDAKGEFTFEGVPPGKYILFSAGRTGSYLSKASPASVEAGQTTNVTLNLMRQR